MAYNTNLAAKYHILGNFCTARDTRLRGNHRILPNLYIMGYLYQVIQLYAFAYDRRAHGCPVNSSIGPHFNVILNNNITYLRYFLYLPSALGAKPKPSLPIMAPEWITTLLPITQSK
jgi:hypothetical protein